MKYELTSLTAAALTEAIINYYHITQAEPQVLCVSEVFKTQMITDFKSTFGLENIITLKKFRGIRISVIETENEFEVLMFSK